MERRRVDKVACYVVRDGTLLVFRHRDHPDAGVQVPAGTVEPGEDPADAAIRELREETGRDAFALVRELGRDERLFDESGRHERHSRRFFEFATLAPLPDRWSNRAEGAYWFEFFWTALTEDLELAGDQHVFIARLGPA